MEDIIFGFKAFNNGLVNHYGFKYEINKLYHTNKDLKFGNEGHGFHMCKNIEDVFRYYDSENSEVCIVMGFGDKILYEDEYNGYYEMYVTEYMIIEKILTREEIISYILNLNPDRVTRFISLFKLTDKEKNIFQKNFKKEKALQKYLDYYQYNNKNAFKEEKK